MKKEKGKRLVKARNQDLMISDLWLKIRVKEEEKLPIKV